MVFFEVWICDAAYLNPCGQPQGGDIRLRRSVPSWAIIGSTHSSTWRLDPGRGTLGATPSLLFRWKRVMNDAINNDSGDEREVLERELKQANDRLAGLERDLKDAQDCGRRLRFKNIMDGIRTNSPFVLTIALLLVATHLAVWWWGGDARPWLAVAIGAVAVGLSLWLLARAVNTASRVGVMNLRERRLFRGRGGWAGVWVTVAAAIGLVWTGGALVTAGAAPFVDAAARFYVLLRPAFFDLAGVALVGSVNQLVQLQAA